MASTSVVFDLLARDRASDKFDRFGKTVGRSSSSMSKFTGLMKTAGKAALLGLGSGLAAAGYAAVKFGQAAAEDEQAAELLSGALQRNAGATKKQVAQVEDWITAIGKAKGVADDDLRPALSRLVTATKDVGEAQLLAQYAMDASAATGKSLESVTMALMKARNGDSASLSKLGINTKNAAGETLKFNDLVQRMGEQFGGAASEKAETFQGKMDRLKLMLSETGEAIGYKLIPVGEKLMDWVTSSAIPGISNLSDWFGVHLMPKLRNLSDWIKTEVIPKIKKFAEEMQNGKGAGGKFADALGKVKDGLDKTWHILKPVIEFMANNKTVVATFAGVIAGVAVATKAWALAQGLLNLALAVTPLGLIIVGVAGLAAGLVYAWRKSEKFRDSVKFVWDALKKFVGWTPLGAIISNFGALKDSVQWVIDKVGELWDKLSGLADKAGGFKNILDAVTPRMGAGGKGGPDYGGKAGADLIASIVAGITKHKVKLDTVLDKLGDYISKKMDKLKGLLAQRSAIVDAFKGFASSIFSTDLSVGEGEAPKTIQALLDAGAAGKAKAQGLLGDVKALISKGLSRDLLTQLQGAGESGMEQIHLLAQGTNEQIAQANADQAATMQALQEAGLAASAAQGIEAAIKQEERDLKLAKAVRDQLEELLRLQDKNTIVQLKIGGHVIQATLLELKRQSGQNLGLA